MKFVADYALENDIKPVGAEEKNGHKVAVIGSGPAGLTHVQVILQELGYDVTVFEALHLDLVVYWYMVFQNFVYQNTLL